MRATNNILKVLGVLSQQRSEEHYALDLSRTAKVNIGTVYAVLDRLERGEYVKSSLEKIDPVIAGRPQRRYYQITGKGLEYFNQQIQEMRAILGGGSYA